MLALVSINHKHLAPRGRVQIRARYLSILAQKKISVSLAARGRAVNPGATSLVLFALRLPGFAGTATRSRLAHKHPWDICQQPRLRSLSTRQPQSSWTSLHCPELSNTNPTRDVTLPAGCRDKLLRAHAISFSS